MTGASQKELAFALFGFLATGLAMPRKPAGSKERHHRGLRA